MNKNQDIHPKAKPMRDSNMELLRIMAMLLVVIVHTNSRGLPEPDAARIAAHTSSAVLQFIVEGLSIIAVDTFVLLSGWYGIRPKLNRFVELLFQLLFFGIVGIGLRELIAPGTLSQVPDFWKSLFLLKTGAYWFVKAYLALYIISPVLNAFIGVATKRQFTWVLVGYFSFQFIMGWMFEGVTWFHGGFSLSSFVGLYLLARYVRLHPVKIWQLSKWFDLTVYLLSAATLAVLLFIFSNHGINTHRLHAYNNPIIIVSALHFMLFFSKIHFHNAFCNWLGASALAVYLTHSSEFLWKIYDNTIIDWFYNTDRPTFILYASTLVLVVFFGSILIDKVRIVVWKFLMRGFHKLAHVVRF